MKTILAGVAVLALVLIRVLLWLPWGTRDKTRRPARFSFLLVFGVVALGIILGWFRFVMRGQ